MTWPKFCVGNPPAHEGPVIHRKCVRPSVVIWSVSLRPPGLITPPSPLTHTSIGLTAKHGTWMCIKPGGKLSSAQPWTQTIAPTPCRRDLSAPSDHNILQTVDTKHPRRAPSPQKEKVAPISSPFPCLGRQLSRARVSRLWPECRTWSHLRVRIAGMGCRRCLGMSAGLSWRKAGTRNLSTRL